MINPYHNMTLRRVLFDKPGRRITVQDKRKEVKGVMVTEQKVVIDYDFDSENVHFRLVRVYPYGNEEGSSCYEPEETHQYIEVKKPGRRNGAKQPHPFDPFPMEPKHQDQR